MKITIVWTELFRSDKDEFQLRLNHNTWTDLRVMN